MMRKLTSLFLILLLFGGLNGMASCSGKASAEKVSETGKNGEIKYAEDMSTFSELIRGTQPVLVDFYADWCAPCRMMAPILEQVSTDMSGKVKIVKVNVDKNQSAAMKYNIRSIPTLILFQNGEIKWQGVGVIQAEQIKQIVATKTN